MAELIFDGDHDGFNRIIPIKLAIYSLIIYLLSIVGLVLLYKLITIIPNTTVLSELHNFSTLIIGTLTYFITIVFIYWKSKQENLKGEDFGLNKFSLKKAINLIVMYVILIIISIVILIIILFVAISIFDINNSNTTSQSTKVLDLHRLLFAALLTPIFEEILFRGVVFGSLKSKYSVNKSILISSIIFALFHVGGAGSPFIWMLGIYTAFMYSKLNSIIPGIFLHMMWNIFVEIVHI